MTLTRLPSFERPPLVETVLSVQFDPIEGFRNAHLGAFWKCLGSNWPHAVDAPPVEPQFEQFGEGRVWGLTHLRLNLLDHVPQRIQIRNATQDGMVQLQNGRLLYNWLRNDGKDYPRYDSICGEFEKNMASFVRFLAEARLGNVVPNQWEVTYVNSLPKGTVWEKPEEWVNLFRWPTGAPIAIPRLNLESAITSWHYEIPPSRGRLHVQVAHQKEGIEGRAEFLRLTLTARGPVANQGVEGTTWQQGLNLGHEVIVLAFQDLTSPRCHSYWGLKHA